MKGPDRSATRLAQPEAPGDAPAVEPSDAALGAGLREGDESALASLYDRHLPGIYDFLARYLRDPHSAEDIAQTTFVRAWERRETLRDPDGVRAWLFTIAHNLATNQLTRGRRAEPIEERFDLAAPGPGPEQVSVNREAAELVWAAASSLEPRQYAVLDLCVRRELSTREVAEVFEMSVGHAAVLVNRAKEALGNAVRYLLVAQRRDQCDRLAALVPAGVRALTPELRSAVDHHMRRCDTCRNLGRSLTSPAELFGGLVALPVPDSLTKAGRDYVLTSAHRRPEGWWGKVRWRRSRLVLGGGVLAILALIGLATFTAARQQSNASPAPSAPAISSPAAVPVPATPIPAAATAPPVDAPPQQQPVATPPRSSPQPTNLPTASPKPPTPSSSPVPKRPNPSGRTVPSILR